MPRVRNPNRDKAKQIYLEHKGDIDLVKIAKMLDTPPGTIRGWKNKDKWDSELNGTFQKDTERSKNKNKKGPPPKESLLVEELEQIENANLTDKQRLFCIFYIKYFNATKAYQKAYKCDYNTATVNGCRLLKKAKIEEEIKRLKANKFKSAMLEKEDILQKYIDIAFADITDFSEFGLEEITYIDKQGKEKTATVNYVNFKSSHEVDGTLISEVKQGKNGISVKLHDKMKALDFLAKNIGLLDIATKERLRMERQKLELLQRKDNDNEDESVDDGFIEALQNSVKDVWEDEE